MANLRLKPHYTVIAHSPDVVELRHGVWNTTSFTLTDEGGRGDLYRLICRLDGSARPSAIAKEEGVPRSDVEALVDHLVSLDVLEASPSSGVDYYLDELLPRPAAANGDIPASPHSARVRVLGDPELVAELVALAAHSLPEAIVEGTVDPARAASLTGRDATWLTDSLRFHETVEQFRDWSGSVVVAISRAVDPLATGALNRICLELDIPWLHATVDGPFLFVGPIVLPGRTACYDCLETRVLMNLRSSESYVRYKSALVDREIRFGRIPLEPVLRSLLVSHTALELVNLVLTGTACTVGKVLAIYLPTMEFSYNEVLRLPGCTSCGTVLERDEEQLYFDIRGLFEGTAA